MEITEKTQRRFRNGKNDIMRKYVNILNYHNDPKFSDIYARANSADPDQTALIRV